MSYGMRVWVLPDPGGAVTHEDRQLLAVGIAYLPAPTQKPVTGGGYIPSDWVYEYEDMERRRRKEMREIKEIVMILSELN